MTAEEMQDLPTRSRIKYWDRFATIVDWIDIEPHIWSRRGDRIQRNPVLVFDGETRTTTVHPAFWPMMFRA